MHVIDLGASLREVWQEISPNLFSVTLLRTTGERNWEIRAHHVFSVRLPMVTEGENFHTFVGPRSGIDAAEAPQGDVADGGSTPPGSTKHHFVPHPVGGRLCSFLVAQDETCKSPVTDLIHGDG